MKISIITVVYNNPKVFEALDSILSQRLEEDDNLELIVIDGGSNDGTVEILEKYRNRIDVLLSEPDDGIYDAMNKGIKVSDGDIIGTLNSDDIYQDEASLSAILQSFKESDAQIVFGDLVYVRETDPSVIVRYWKSRPYTEGLFERGWMPPHPTFFVRKQVYLDHGCFDLRFRLASDFELTMRFLAKAKVLSLYIPRIIVRMRMGGATNNSLINILKGNLESYRACKKNNLKVSLLFVVFKILSRIPQFFKRPNAVIMEKQ